MNTLREWLLGEWVVDRTVRHDDGMSTTFHGQAVFSPLNTARLLYAERGTHWVDGQAMPAERQYLYDFLESERAQVHFTDGRFFHTFRLLSQPTMTVHDCGEDKYRGEFCLIGADRWRVRWNVSGPKKAYVSTTEWVRFIAS